MTGAERRETGSPTVEVSKGLDDAAWGTLLSRIASMRCTPFLGPETCAAFSVPSASQIAEAWADKAGYPFDDRTNLPRVAQYLTYRVNKGDKAAVKEALIEQFRGLKPPDFSDPDEPHRVLASLPLPIYVTTHYFEFMRQALAYQRKDPRLEVCRWNPPRDPDEPVLARGYDPTPANPLVYHLFGYAHPDWSESLVLTEDDHLDFLVRASKDDGLVPLPVQNAMVNHSLLFFGYQMADLDFRVLLRSLDSLWERKQARERRNVSVQMVHVGDSTATERRAGLVKEYFEGYGNKSARLSIGIYWGSTRDFMVELRRRWENKRDNVAGG